MEIVNTRGIEFSGRMPSVVGAHSLQKLNMHTTQDRHIRPGGLEAIAQDPTGSFADLLNKSIQSVEETANRSSDLSARAVFEPDSVELHEVMLAAEKSRLALNFTRTMADGLVRTFKEITNPR
ncbi:MAG: flagellar hook-basal body complex protein FliE [Spirochaetales bacterium]|nr:flagellar hook-basal body complex protein FliE [Spirochaetales bacterium]